MPSVIFRKSKFPAAPAYAFPDFKSRTFPIRRSALLTVEFSMAGLFFDPIPIFSDRTQKNVPFDLIPSKNPLAKKTSAWYTGGILKKTPDFHNAGLYFTRFRSWFPSRDAFQAKIHLMTGVPSDRSIKPQPERFCPVPFRMIANQPGSLPRFCGIAFLQDRIFRDCFPVKLHLCKFTLP